MALLAGPALVLSAPSQGEEVASRRFSSASRGLSCERFGRIEGCARDASAPVRVRPRDRRKRHVALQTARWDRVERNGRRRISACAICCGESGDLRQFACEGKGGHLRASVPSFKPQRAIEVAIGLTARGHAPLQAKAPGLLDEARDGIDPQTGAQIGKHEGAVATHAFGVALHHLKGSANVGRKIDLVDDKQI